MAELEKVTQVETEYDASEIQVLEGLAHIYKLLGKHNTLSNKRAC